MRAPTPENAALLFAVAFSYSWRKISTVCGTISHSKPPSTRTSIRLFKIFQALVLVTDSQQLLEDKSWLSIGVLVAGGREGGRRGGRKGHAGRQQDHKRHKLTSKIKTNSVALTYTNLHLFIGAALKHRPSPAPAIRMWGEHSSPTGWITLRFSKMKSSPDGARTALCGHSTQGDSIKADSS